MHGIKALGMARAIRDSPGVEEATCPGLHNLPGKTDISKRRHQLVWIALSPSCVPPSSDLFSAYEAVLLKDRINSSSTRGEFS